MFGDVKCDQCGRLATMVRCTPVYKPIGLFEDEEFKSSVREISCKINCPKCGKRIQPMTSVMS